MGGRSCLPSTTTAPPPVSPPGARPVTRTEGRRREAAPHSAASASARGSGEFASGATSTTRRAGGTGSSVRWISGRTSTSSWRTTPGSPSTAGSGVQWRGERSWGGRSSSTRLPGGCAGCEYGESPRRGPRAGERNLREGAVLHPSRLARWGLEWPPRRGIAFRLRPGCGPHGPLPARGRFRVPEDRRALRGHPVQPPLPVHGFPGRDRGPRPGDLPPGRAVEGPLPARREVLDVPLSRRLQPVRERGTIAPQDPIRLARRAAAVGGSLPPGGPSRPGGPSAARGGGARGDGPTAALDPRRAPRDAAHGAGDEQVPRSVLPRDRRVARLDREGGEVAPRAGAPERPGAPRALP